MRVVAEVDVELGLTRVVWIGTAQDVGKAINPLAVEGQIEGGTAQGLGLALMEEIQTRDGLITNASFTDYLIPTALDMPPVTTELIEDARAGCALRRQGRRRAADRRLDRGGRLGAARRDRPRAGAGPVAPDDIALEDESDTRPAPAGAASASAGTDSRRTTTATDASTIAAPSAIRQVISSCRTTAPSAIATTGLT